MVNTIDSALPPQARVHKGVPKSKFFTKAIVNTRLKREFTDKIQKIYWEYKLAPGTIGIPSTETVEEVQIFYIELKERTIPKNALKLIDRVIPYPILYVFSYNDSLAYGITLKGTGEQRYYFTDWGAEKQFTFEGTTLETVYQGLVKTFIDQPPHTEADFATIVETDKKRQVLEREIAALQNKIINEKQFNKKVELNSQLQLKQKKLGELGIKK